MRLIHNIMDHLLESIGMSILILGSYKLIVGLILDYLDLNGFIVYALSILIGFFLMTYQNLLQRIKK